MIDPSEAGESTETEPPRYCGACGALASPIQRFCALCGTALCRPGAGAPGTTSHVLLVQQSDTSDEREPSHPWTGTDRQDDAAVVRDVLTPYGLTTLEQAQAVMPLHQYEAIVRQVGELRHAGSPAATRPRPDAIARPASTASLTERLAPVTLLLLVAMAIFFVIESLWPGGSESVDTLFTMGATTPDTFRSGEVWRLVASCFLHIGIVHIGGNAIALFWLGRMAERLYGPVRYLGIYLASGIAGGILSVWVSTYALEAGASGAIWGIMGALLIGSWRNEDRPGHMSGKEIRQSIIAVVILNILVSFSPGVSISAHLGGCVTGCALALCIPFATTQQRRVTTIACNAASWAIIAGAGGLMLTALG